MSTIRMFICHNLTLNTTMIPHNMHIYMLHITRIHCQHYTYLYVQHIYHTNVSKNKTLLSIFICTMCSLSMQVVIDKANKGLIKLFFCAPRNLQMVKRKIMREGFSLKTLLKKSHLLLTQKLNCLKFTLFVSN